MSQGKDILSHKKYLYQRKDTDLKQKRGPQKLGQINEKIQSRTQKN